MRYTIALGLATTIIPFVSARAWSPAPLHGRGHAHLHNGVKVRQESAEIFGRAVSMDGQCGASAGGNVCRQGACCSSVGWCGYGDAWCGKGCQADFSGGGVCSPAGPDANFGLGSRSSFSQQATSASSSSASSSSGTSEGSGSLPIVKQQRVHESGPGSADPKSLPATLSTSSAGPSSSSGGQITAANFVSSSSSQGATTAPSTSGGQITAANFVSSSSGQGATTASIQATGVQGVSQSLATPGNIPANAPQGPGQEKAGKVTKGSSTAASLTGSDGSAWPEIDEWYESYEAMWTANQAVMTYPCYGGGAANSASELSALSSAIPAVAASAGVDSRVVLAIVLQESHGCVRLMTTGSGSPSNPGIMQSHNGVGSCFGYGSKPCPAEMITQMLVDGVMGGSDPKAENNDNLLIALAGSPAEEHTALKYYQMARFYNGGNGTAIDWTNLGITGSASTATYPMAIAQRLVGWVN